MFLGLQTVLYIQVGVPSCWLCAQLSSVMFNKEHNELITHGQETTEDKHVRVVIGKGAIHSVLSFQ